MAKRKAKKSKRPAKKKKAMKKKKKVTKSKRVKKAKKAKAKKAKKMKKAKTGKKTVTKAVTKVKAKALGEVVHYYDKIGVAIIELKSPLNVGDAVTFKRGDHEHTQKIKSMQIEHASIASAKKGDVVGVKVTKEIHEGAEVIPA